MPHPVLLIALALGACASRNTAEPPAADPPAAATTETTAMPDAAVTLDWSLAPAGDHLDIRYALTNHTDARIYVADGLLEVADGALQPTDRVIVAPTRDPGVVRFVRGIVEPDGTEVAAHYAPAAVHLDPGATHEGAARAPLPLTAWHNYAPADPIPAGATSAVLEIAWLPGDGAEWGSMPLSGGGTATVPQLGTYFTKAKLARGAVIPLP